MAMSVAHNIGAMNTTRHLNRSTGSLNGSLEKLSSGYRINTGKDGPADLVISEQLRSQTNGLERAVRNTNEAINVISIAEGALNEMNSILKTMKALAIHASSETTSADQIEADQAEMDSAIQTIERIAQSTRYSNVNLLNGSQELTYSTGTEIKGTQNNALVDTSKTSFEQIYKREGYQVTISYTGAVNADKTTNLGDADMTKQASKAYLEIDTIEGSLSQIDEDGFLTQSQSFILTGALGSRQFSFGQGATISEIVSTIHNYAGSTGIDASLTFNSAQEINAPTTASSITADAVDTLTAFTDTTSVVLFDNYTTDEDGETVTLATAFVAPTGGVVFGKNTDGNGNLYIKVTGDGSTYEVYKDASLSAASLVGSGSSGGTDFVAANNSGLEGIDITLDTDNAKYGDVVIMSLANIALGEDNAQASGVMAGVTADTTANAFDMEFSTATGVQLGVNTDSAGKIYTKVVLNDDGTGTVYAYNDESYSNESLVAKSADGITLSAAATVVLNQVWNADHTASTGLGMALTLSSTFDADKAGTFTGSVQFTNLGARVYASDYGSDNYVQLQQISGGLFTYYDQQDKFSSSTLVEAGVTYRQAGQDATVNVNGQQFKTNGLKLDLATSDMMAKFVFNEGKSGTTTIAQVGYGEGTIFTKNGALTIADETAATTGDFAGISAHLNQANHNTKETVGKFQSGLQLQLGEGSGDQNRTVISIKAANIDSLGKTTVTGQWDSGNAVYSERTFTLRDIMGGQDASLSQNATLAMSVIDQAIDDVSALRAQLGAVQANMLQTNANNLEVAVENITLTESAIRDTDMASEMTRFTNAQILNSAGVSMLAQANSQAQNVLQLLR